MSVPPELKKEGSDWFAIFNGKEGSGGVKKKTLDVGLMHALMHERFVYSCVTTIARSAFADYRH